jgi:hypothetical protein
MPSDIRPEVGVKTRPNGVTHPACLPPPTTTTPTCGPAKQGETKRSGTIYVRIQGVTAESLALLGRRFGKIRRTPSIPDPILSSEFFDTLPFFVVVAPSLESD